jgi:hypothetical protein
MDLCAQKIDVNDFDNKAQAYAILSAQYSKDAYYYSTKIYFSGSISTIKQNCDTAIFYAQSATEYADSAYLIANDTSASLFFEWKVEEEGLISKNEDITNNDSITEGNKRDNTRLESDEYSYLNVKEMYGKRLIEIEDERLLLEKELKNSSGKRKLEIQKIISQLKKEESEIFIKMKNSADRLISVRNELSEEMLKIVDKDIFTTGKEDFYNEKVPVPLTSKMPEGLVYKVQIGFFKSHLPPDHFAGIFPISKEKIDKIYYRYVAGNFAKYEEAKNATKAIAKKGYSDSFVIAFIDGKKVSISEAISKEKTTTN